MLPRRPWDALWRHGTSRGSPRTDFDSIWGAPEALSGLIWNRFSRRFCQLAWLAEFQAKCTASIKMHKIARVSSKFEQIGSNLLAVRSSLLGIRANLFEIPSNSLENLIDAHTVVRNAIGFARDFVPIFWEFQDFARDFVPLVREFRNCSNSDGNSDRLS